MDKFSLNGLYFILFECQTDRPKIAGFQHVAELVVDRVLAMRIVLTQRQPNVPESLVAEARRAFLDNRDKVWPEALSSAV